MYLNRACYALNRCLAVLRPSFQELFTFQKRNGRQNLQPVLFYQR